MSAAAAAAAAAFSSPFKLAALPNKGIAVVATRAIPAGTLLFTEQPLLLLARESHATSHSARVLAGFARLPPAAGSALMDLCSNLAPGAAEAAVVLGVWKANVFCLDEDGTVNGLFALAARLNHACCGGENCRWEWDSEEGVMRFWTDQDVEVGCSCGV